jgi:hypothetical protein
VQGKIRNPTRTPRRRSKGSFHFNRRFGFVFRGQRRQQGGQRADDGDDYQQFDQRERALAWLRSLRDFAGSTADTGLFIAS